MNAPNFPEAGNDKQTDVTRSQHRQAQAAASTDGAEQRPEGAKDKGSPAPRQGSHQEGETPIQTDKPTMNPSGIDPE